MKRYNKKWLISNNIKFDKLIIISNIKKEDCLNNKINVFIYYKLEICEKVYKKIHI